MQPNANANANAIIVETPSIKTLALIYHSDDDRQVVNLLWQAVHDLKHKYHLIGLLNQLDDQQKPIRSTIVSIFDDKAYTIMQNLGKNSQSCGLNPQGLANASEVFIQALAQPNKPDVIVFNRFGKAEADGGGFIQEYSEALLKDIVVITIINEKFISNWQHFLGKTAKTISLNHDSLVQIIEQWLAKKSANESVNE